MDTGTSDSVYKEGPALPKKYPSYVLKAKDEFWEHKIWIKAMYFNASYTGVIWVELSSPKHCASGASADKARGLTLTSFRVSAAPSLSPLPGGLDT